MQIIKGKAALLAAASTLVLPLMGQAQAEESAEEAIQFEEIVVTAGRREQNLQDVPAAVTAVDPSEFLEKGIKGVGGILDYTAGVSYSDSGVIGRGSIAARGVSQTEDTPVFGVYLDDTPVSTNTAFARGGSVLFDAMLMDIERVEVIKGPQGTLYGATSVGGMMRYISRDPALEEFRATAGVDVSTTDGGDWSRDISGRVSIPLVQDKLGVTLSGFDREIGGYVDYMDLGSGEVTENVNSADVYGYAADVLFEPTEKLRFRLKYLKQKTSYPIGGAVYLADLETDEGAFGDYVTVDELGDNAIDYEIASGTVSYDLGWGEISSTTSYVQYEVGGVSDVTAVYGGFIDFLSGQAPGTTTSVKFLNSAGSEKYVQELRLTADRMGNVEWLAGLYYTSEETFNLQFLDVTPVVNAADANFPSEYEEYAAFADVTYYFSDEFDVTAGMRLSKSNVDLAFASSGLLFETTDEEYPTLEDTVDTYLIAARYRPMDELSLYARIASGYRPATSVLPVSGSELSEVMESDHVWSYEIGAKGALADNMFSYDVAFWMIDWSNFQTSIIVNNISTSGNAFDGVKGHGFEGAFIFRPVENLTVNANFAYAKSTLNSYEAQIGGADGDDVPQVPEWTWSIKADYGFDLVSGWMANLGGGLRYVGKFQTAFSNPDENAAFPKDTQNDSRLVADLNLSLSNENMSVSLYANNLFNTRSLVGRRDTAVSIGYFERPRTVGVSMKVDF
ncbi:TonB-dependent receptor [Emcibacter sp.]|uniref:TonB-dependent receptor n=1 Tax=Emcibacter sp. TaxID=1979954 RepID=UPI003A9489C7